MRHTAQVNIRLTAEDYAELERLSVDGKIGPYIRRLIKLHLQEVGEGSAA